MKTESKKIYNWEYILGLVGLLNMNDIIFERWIEYPEEFLNKVALLSSHNPSIPKPNVKIRKKTSTTNEINQRYHCQVKIWNGTRYGQLPS